MKHADMSSAQRAEHQIDMDQARAHEAERESAMAARKARRAARLANIPANANSVQELRAIVQGLIDEVKELRAGGM